MGTADLIDIFRDAIITGLKVAGPILLVSVLVGLIISIFQAATSINEQTMTFVPKLIFIGLILILTGGWMLQQMMDFVFRIFELIATKI
ncbi:MAG: flagellar biosynthesis protein FliQ [Eubacteriaceae bacterium]|nr:flagellar biosynthesis protein FliQ [Eubacteriaceae bacterium]